MLEIVIIALLVFIVLQEHLNRKERKRLVDAVMAKSFKEFKQEEHREKVEPQEELPPEFQPVEQASDEDFTKAIKKELGREGKMEKAKEALKKIVR